MKCFSQYRARLWKNMPLKNVIVRKPISAKSIRFHSCTALVDATGGGAQGPVPVPVQRAQLPLQQALRRGRLRLPLPRRVRRPEARLRHGLRARLARGQLHLRVQITHLRVRTLSGLGITTLLLHIHAVYIL